MDESTAFGVEFQGRCKCITGQHTNQYNYSSFATIDVEKNSIER